MSTLEDAERYRELNRPKVDRLCSLLRQAARAGREDVQEVVQEASEEAGEVDRSAGDKAIERAGPIYTAQGIFSPDFELPLGYPPPLFFENGIQQDVSLFGFSEGLGGGCYFHDTNYMTAVPQRQELATQYAVAPLYTHNLNPREGEPRKRRRLRRHGQGPSPSQDMSQLYTSHHTGETGAPNHRSLCWPTQVPYEPGQMSHRPPLLVPGRATNSSAPFYEGVHPPQVDLTHSFYGLSYPTNSMDAGNNNQQASETGSPVHLMSQSAQSASTSNGNSRSASSGFRYYNAPDSMSELQTGGLAIIRPWAGQNIP